MKNIYYAIIISTALLGGFSEGANATKGMQSAHFYGRSNAGSTHPLLEKVSSPIGLENGYHKMTIPAGTFGDHPEMTTIIHEDHATGYHPESIVRDSSQPNIDAGLKCNGNPAFGGC